jgi:hypothetical protein
MPAGGKQIASSAAFAGNAPPEGFDKKRNRLGEPARDSPGGSTRYRPEIAALWLASRRKMATIGANLDQDFAGDVRL